MKKPNAWIVGIFLLITLIQYADALGIGNGRSHYLSVVYFAAFVISLFMTRKSKACNLFYLIYSFVLCAAILISFILALLLNNGFFVVVWFVLIDPFISLTTFLGGGTNPLQILASVLVWLFPFITTGISFCFYTKNKCEQKEPGSV